MDDVAIYEAARDEDGRPLVRMAATGRVVARMELQGGTGADEARAWRDAQALAGAANVAAGEARIEGADSEAPELTLMPSTIEADEEAADRRDGARLLIQDTLRKIHETAGIVHEGDRFEDPEIAPALRLLVDRIERAQAVLAR